MGQKNGLHAFGYTCNSAESEPIWMTFRTLWSNCWGLALADFWRDSYSSNSLRRSRNFLWGKWLAILPISRRKIFTTFEHNNVDQCRHVNFRNRILKSFAIIGRFSKKKLQTLLTNWCPDASRMADCFIHAGPRRRSFCRQNCCCVRGRTCVLAPEADHNKRRPLMRLMSFARYIQVPGLTATSEQDMRPCNQLVFGQEASAFDVVELRWCGAFWAGCIVADLSRRLLFQLHWRSTAAADSAVSVWLCAWLTLIRHTDQPALSCDTVSYDTIRYVAIR